ncbi:CotH kinase family protein [Candidatus Margulisiibacteriota bacterium]
MMFRKITLLQLKDIKQYFSKTTLMKHFTSALLILLLISIIFILVQITPQLDLLINEVSTNSKESPGWIELYNDSSTTLNLHGFGLSDNISNPRKWLFKDISIGPYKHLLLFASGKNIYRNGQIHTNFKLSGKDSYVILSDHNGKELDRINIKSLPINRSLGRKSDGSYNLQIFTKSSPGESNSKRSSRQGILSNLTFSIPGGFYYKSPLSVELTSSNPLYGIFYTLDGSDPVKKGKLYTQAINISSTCVLRAALIDKNGFYSKTWTQTYFISEYYSLPVISIATDPDNLWSAQKGIYNDTSIYLRKSWERPMHIEFFENRYELGFKTDACFRLFGRSAVNLPQKSFAIYFKRKYGADKLLYPLFPENPVSEFRSFLLRSSSDDWSLTLIRDSLMQHLLKGYTTLDIQYYRPAILFLNGKYWGIYNIREKINESYIATNHNINPERIDFLSVDLRKKAQSPNNINDTWIEVLAGNQHNYSSLLSYLKNNDLSAENNYKHIKNIIDIDNFIDYTIAQMYFANRSWPHNRKLWKERKKNGKWRWLIYDLDRGFIYYSNNYFQDFYNKDFLYKCLLNNLGFRYRFIQVFAHHLNTTFHPKRIIKEINKFKEKLAPEIYAHTRIWGGLPDPGNYNKKSFSSDIIWRSNINDMVSFAKKRGEYIRKQMINEFNLSGTSSLTLNNAYKNKGNIYLYDHLISEKHFNGVYFKDIPIEIKATAKKGHRFKKWSCLPKKNIIIKNISKTKALVILKGDVTINAYFE